MINWTVLWSYSLPLFFCHILLPVKLLHLPNRSSTVMFFCVCAPLHLISVAFMNMNERLQGQFTRLYYYSLGPLPQGGVELYHPILVYGWMLVDPALCSSCADNHYCYMFAFITTRSYLGNSVLLYSFPPSDSYILLPPFMSCSLSHGSGFVDVLVRAEHSAVTCSYYLEQLWVFALIVAFSKQNFLWSVLRQWYSIHLFLNA